jgi:hypothetical protein
MSCQNTKNLIAIGIFGRLTPSQREELEAHIKACPECASRYEESAHLIGLRPESEVIPPPDLEQSWEVISSRTEGRRRFLGNVHMRKWAFVTGMFLIVFILGYFAGKNALNIGSPTLASIPVGTQGPTLTSYADNLKPVLVNFLNRDGVSPPENIRRLERQLISDMLIRTRFLKSLAAHSEDLAIVELLQDLDFILTAMDNMRPEDRDTAQHLARMIREQQVSLRLQQLITAKSTL